MKGLLENEIAGPFDDLWLAQRACMDKGSKCGGVSEIKLARKTTYYMAIGRVPYRPNTTFYVVCGGRVPYQPTQAFRSAHPSGTYYRVKSYIKKEV